jgi:HlyD family secretion protein
MDIVRKGASKRKAMRRGGALVALLVIVGGVTWGVGRLQPALPAAEAGTVWPDTVKRGPMLRQVRGTGSLVPEDVVWITAQIDGRIEKIDVQPGTPVKAGAAIMELSNPTLTEAMVAAEYDLKQAEAALTDLDVTLQSGKFDKEAAAAQVASDYQQAKIKAERDKQLADLGLIPSIDARLTQTDAHQLEIQNQIEERRMAIIDRSSEAQLAAQRVKIDQFRAIYDLKKQQVQDLKVVAAVDGMLEQLGNATATPAAASGSVTELEVGQNVTAGTILARIAQQDRLKAQIKVTETEAKDVALGQPAAIDTRNGIAPGKVIRVDPAAVNGTVLVDVGFTSPLPAGARPDLSVDGTIDIERIGDAVYIDRPATGQAHSTITLFRMDPGDKTATRTTVKLGRASANTIEVVDGLKVGDRVIVSDMSAMEKYDHIRVN